MFSDTAWVGTKAILFQSLGFKHCAGPPRQRGVKEVKDSFADYVRCGDIPFLGAILFSFFHKGNYALINVFMKPKSQDPSSSLGAFHPVPELYGLLLRRAQFPHASYPREQLLDKFLEEIRRS